MTPSADLDAVLLAHMRECLDRIDEYTGSERARFMASRMVQDAVVRNLQTLTESSQRLSAESKALAPSIPWRELSGFRNVVVHGYLGLDADIIWSVVERELPALRAAVDRLLALNGPRP